MNVRTIPVNTQDIIAKARENPLVAGLPDHIMRLLLVAGVTVQTYRQAEQLGVGREDLQFIALQVHELVHRELLELGIKDYDQHHKIIDVVDELLAAVLTEHYQANPADVEAFSGVES